VAFDPRGTHVLTGAEEPGAMLWALPRPEPIAATEPGLWVQSITGKRMDANGVLSRLSSYEWQAIQHRLAPGGRSQR
jgi:hypothetical protein